MSDAVDIAIEVEAPPRIVTTTKGDMDETNAARYLAYRLRRKAINPTTLRHWRNEAKGPRYANVGRFVWYKLDVLDAWCDEQLRDAAA